MTVETPGSDFLAGKFLNLIQLIPFLSIYWTEIFLYLF